MTKWSWSTLVHVLDILLVAYLLYRIIMLIRGTRAWRLVTAIVIFALLLYLSKAFQLSTLYWILDKASILAPVALVILLLPELRQTLEYFGQAGLWPQKLLAADIQTETRTIEELVAGAAELAAQSVGALIVIERGAPLDDVVANGITLNAKVSAPLLGSIFYEKNPLHDGAVILRGDIVVAAACRLPLSDSARLDKAVHMRHRAAVGISENSDCLVIVVSEERGTISVASEGKLRRLAGHLELREVLKRELRNEDLEGVTLSKIRSRGRKREEARK